ncbi:MAG: hypothetical protein P4N41_23570 [Negativicutes bacterium]|nr:hypothetical protein [Negativicutes bacterium]MDR3592646.1 hypothetical protein [Negativicutes bacterium]
MTTKSVACYDDGFCVEDNNNEGAIAGNLISLGFVLALVIGVVLYNNASLIGTELLANPLLAGF